MSDPSGWDTAADIGWNALTAIPGVGTVVSGVSAVNDLSHAVGATNDQDRQQAIRDMAGDAVSMVPMVGSAMSFGGIGYDIISNDTSGNLENQLMGGKDAFPADSENGGQYTPQPAGDKTSGGQWLHNAWNTISDPFGAMAEGQRQSDQQRAADGSTTGEAPPPYINNGPTGDPMNDM